MYSIASIDLGSNAARLAIGYLDKDYSLISTENYREAVRLGQDVFSSGVLSEATLVRAVDAFKAFRDILDDHKVTVLRAVTTSAMREAKNAQELIRRIKDQCRIELEVISGEEEARLIFSGVSAKLNLKDKTAVLVDIGGGSVEITLAVDAEIAYANSYPIGVVRLLSILEERRRGRHAFPRLLRKFSAAFKSQIEQLIADRPVDLLVGTGGNIECIGELRQSILGKKRNSLIRASELNTIRAKLESLSFQERITQLKLKPDRADVIFPGCLLLEQVFEQINLPEMLVPNVGLKDGVLAELIPRMQGRSLSPQKRRRAVLASARELGRKYRVDSAHVRNVARLALEMFEQSKELHALGEEAQVLLEAAALVHDVGRFINVNSHHKHSQYILRSEPFAALTQHEKELVACIVRYHRRALPSSKHDEYAVLVGADKQLVSKLAGILRIANALDHEHAGNVKKVTLRAADDGLAIELEGSNEMLLEKWALQEAVHMFEEVFKTKIFLPED